MAAMGGLRKGPQEYHSAPTSIHVRIASQDALIIFRLTCDAGSAVVETLHRGRTRWDKIAAGKDIGLSDNALAIITTMMVIIVLFHWRHDFVVMPGLWLFVGRYRS
jgi:hypothetical protein